MSRHTKYFTAAGITIQLDSDWAIGENTLHPKFKQFETVSPGTDNVILHHHFRMPDKLKEKMAQDRPIYNQDHWKIYRGKAEWIYNYTPLLPDDPGFPATAVFNSTHTHADIYAPGLSEKDYQNASFGALTLFNTDQILFSRLLCERNGIIIHANGFDLNGQGFLLTGASGAGKSTLSSLLGQKGLNGLCDDRMFITQKNHQFWIHGNWCHGTVCTVANLSVPLQAVFFLEQAQKNLAIPVFDRREKSQLLLKSLVKAFLSPVEWQKTFSIVADLVDQIDCYTLKFDLSGDAFHTISTIVNSNTAKQGN